MGQDGPPKGIWDNNIGSHTQRCYNGVVRMVDTYIYKANDPIWPFVHDLNDSAPCEFISCFSVTQVELKNGVTIKFNGISADDVSLAARFHALKAIAISAISP